MAMNQRLLRPMANFAGLRVDLVAYWPLNEDAASNVDVTAVDATGRGNNLVSNNTVPSTPGLIGNARRFVRSNLEYLSGTHSDLNLGEIAWTITFWFFASTGSSNQIQCLIGKDTANARQFGIFFNNPTTNSLRIEAFTTTGSEIGAQIDGLSRNQWNFVSVTHETNSADILLSVNRSSSSTTTRTSGNWASFNSQFNIGRRQFPTFEFYADCDIDEVAVWHRALSGSELDKLYNNGRGINLRR